MECITSCERTSHMLLTEVNEIFSNTITSTGADIFFDAVMESLCSIGSKGVVLGIGMLINVLS